MEIPSDEETVEAADRLSAIVQEVNSDPRVLLDEGTLALAERAVAGGARQAGDGQYRIHAGALSAALNFYFLRGCTFGSIGDLARGRAIRGVLEAAAGTEGDQADWARGLRDNHAEILIVTATRHYLSFSSSQGIEPLLRAELLLREVLEVSPDEVTWRNAACTFLAVVKTLAEETGDPGVLHDAISLGQTLYERIASQDAVTEIEANTLSEYGSCLLLRARLTGNIVQVSGAVDVLRTAARLAPTRPTEALARLNLSEAMYALVDARDDPLADEAFHHATAAAELVAPEERQRQRYYRALGDAWMRRDSGDSAALLAAARAYAEALRTADEGQSELLTLLAEMLYRAFDADPEDAAAVALSGEAGETLPNGWLAVGLFAEKLLNAYLVNADGRYLDTAVACVKRMIVLSNRSLEALSLFGRALTIRFNAVGSAADGTQAVAVLREALARSEDDSYRFENATNLAAVLQRMFNDKTDEVTHDKSSDIVNAAMLSEIIDALRTARAITPKPNNAAALASALAARFQLRSTEVDRDEALVLWRSCAASAPDDLRYVKPLVDLLMAFGDDQDFSEDVTEALAWAWRLRRGAPSDLKHLETLGRVAVLAGNFRKNVDAVHEVADELRAEVITKPWVKGTETAICTYLNLLQILFEETHDTDSLVEAIEVGSRLLERPGLPSSREAWARVAVAEALVRRAEFTGSRSDLDEAIAGLRHVESLAEDDDGDLYGHRAALVNALAYRYGETASAADLDEAIALNAQALRGESQLVRAVAESNLCMALYTRATVHRDPGDLGRAIEAGQQAVQLTPSGHRDRPRRQFHLAIALRTLAQIWQDRPDAPALINQAVDAAREATAETPPAHSEHFQYAHAVAGALLLRYEISGEVADLDEAMRTFASVIDGTQPGSDRHVAALSNLARAHLLRGERLGGSDGDLEAAASYARRVVEAAGAASPRAAFGRMVLAEGLDALAVRTGNPARSREAAGHLRDTALASASPPHDRIRAAIRWGELEVRDGRRESALHAWATVIDLLPVVVWFGLDRSLRESHIGRYEGVARDAAAAAVEADRPDRGVVFLEHGRNVIWAGLLQTRTSLDDVRATHPELTEGLERVRARLHALDRADALNDATVQLGG